MLYTEERLIPSCFGKDVMRELLVLVCLLLRDRLTVLSMSGSCM